MEFESWDARAIIQRYRDWRARREEEYIVTINNPRMRIKGKVKGAKVLPYFKYVAFQGIPYALPPVGEFRFQPPREIPLVSPTLSSRIFKAYSKPKACAQQTRLGMIRGSEDCLYLNVYTPRKPKNISKLLPVLVYIHGGGFSSGTGSLANPENLLREDLIVVTINYRLDIFGFLNMRSDNCRGNAGMKDQVMALRWVQNNIEKFKGNPNNVTICGQSAGGSSVNFHMISPMSKGLFQQAIVMSGGVYCPWGYGGHAKHVKKLFKDALGRDNHLRNVVVEVLKTRKTKDLLLFGKRVVEDALMLEPKRMFVYYSPTVEYIEEGAFLPDTVENLMKEAKPVPTIAGITKQEGYQYFRTDPLGALEIIKETEELKELLRHNFRWKDLTAVDKHIEKIKALYFPNQEKMKKEEKKHQLATLITDIYFRRFYDNFEIGNLLSEGWPPFYVYEFDYFTGKSVTPMTRIDICRPAVRPTAAEHSDDFYFLFDPECLQTLFSRLPNQNYLVQREIYSVKINMCNLWGSFCRTGIPKSRWEGDAHVNWLHHTERHPHYLRIGEKLTLINRRLNDERWSALNAMCQLESTIPSLAESPQTPNKEFKLLQLLNLEPDPPSPDTVVEPLNIESGPLSSETELVRLEPEPSSLETAIEVIHEEPDPSLLQTVVEIHPEPNPPSLETAIELIHLESEPSSPETAVEPLHLESVPSSLETAVEIHPEHDPSSLETAIEVIHAEPDPSLLQTVVEIHPVPNPPSLETAIELIHLESEPSSPETAVEPLHLESVPSSLETAIEVIHAEPDPSLLQTVVEIHPVPNPPSLETAIELIHLESEPSSPETAVEPLHLESVPSSLETAVEIHPEPDPSSSETAIEVIHLESEPSLPETTIELLHLQSEPSSPEIAIRLLYLEPDPSSPETAEELINLEPDPSSPEKAVELVHPEPDPSSLETAVETHLDSETSSFETTKEVLPLESEPSSLETPVELSHLETMFELSRLETMVELSHLETLVKLSHLESEPSSPETSIRLLYLEPDPSSLEKAVELVHPEPDPSSLETAVETHLDSEASSFETTKEVLPLESEPSSPEITADLSHLETTVELSHLETMFELSHLETVVELSHQETMVELSHLESEPSSPETSIRLLYLEPDPSSPEKAVELVHPEPDPSSSETAAEKVGLLETEF